MKKNRKTRICVLLVVCLVLFALLLCFNKNILYYPNSVSPEPTTKPTDPTRESYNIGSCYDMKKSVCYFLIFLDDEESQWNKEEKQKFIDKKLLPSLNYLSEKALEHDITLNHKFKEYSHDQNVPLTFDGIIDTDTVTNGKQENILNEVAKSMGYSSTREMDSTLKNELRTNQIAYLLVLNKQGRAYKYSDVISSAERYEFCVFFDDSITYNGNTCMSTIAHEILHLFGAEDYYDPYGKYPQREKLADKLYPNDIMNENFKDINNAQIGAYTAYSIGWTNNLPKECDVPEWWK